MATLAPQQPVLDGAVADPGPARRPELRHRLRGAVLRVARLLMVAAGVATS